MSRKRTSTFKTASDDDLPSHGRRADHHDNREGCRIHGMLRLMKVLESITLRLEHFPFRLILPVSLPGLTGQSSTHGRCLLDPPGKPGDDSTVGCPTNR